MSETYIHGFSAEEQARLTMLQSILNQSQIDMMDLQNVQRVLDTGSGLGQMTRAIARQLPRGCRVVGVEQNQAQLAEANRQAASDGESDLVEFRQGDAAELPLMPGEESSFDLVHGRFLLEHVGEPLPVVRQMVAAARPGGQIVLVDDDHDLLRIWPECEPAQRAWTVYWNSYYPLGFDPLIGRKLGSLLFESGARDIRLTSIFYGAQAGQKLFDPVIDNFVGVIAGSARLLQQHDLFSHDEMELAIAAIGQWRQLPDASLWYSLPMATGIRPGTP